MEGKTNIWSSKFEYQINLAQSVLEEKGISSYVLDKKDSAYVVLGEIELYVDEADAAQAMEILREAEVIID